MVTKIVPDRKNPFRDKTTFLIFLILPRKPHTNSNVAKHWAIARYFSNLAKRQIYWNFSMVILLISFSDRHIRVIVNKALDSIPQLTPVLGRSISCLYCTETISVCLMGEWLLLLISFRKILNVPFYGKKKPRKLKLIFGDWRKFSLCNDSPTFRSPKLKLGKKRLQGTLSKLVKTDDRI